jgi:hypothetical protein
MFHVKHDHGLEKANQVHFCAEKKEEVWKLFATGLQMHRIFLPAQRIG